jgi:hypothetical protein
VLLRAQGDVLFERHQTRERTTRHPGHVESASLEEQRQALSSGQRAALAIEGSTIEVETTDFSKLDYSATSDRSQRSPLTACDTSLTSTFAIRAGQRDP